MARVLVGVTGGIAAYKACELVRLLVKAGHEVTPILTPDAERFVTAHTFEALARRAFFVERPTAGMETVFTQPLVAFVGWFELGFRF